jgi:hypothetical protein
MQVHANIDCALKFDELTSLGVARNWISQDSSTDESRVRAGRRLPGVRVHWNVAEHVDPLLLLPTV